jgi:hypothetical protein
MEKHCSFCGKPERDVRKLIAGGGAQPKGRLARVYICDQCVRLYQAMVTGESAAASESAECVQSQFPETLVEWFALSIASDNFEWASEPQADGTVLLVVRRAGTQKSVGGVFPAGTAVGPELVHQILRTLGERL